MPFGIIDRINCGDPVPLGQLLDVMTRAAPRSHPQPGLLIVMRTPASPDDLATITALPEC
jgi:hypothetical protein